MMGLSRYEWVATSNIHKVAWESILILHWRWTPWWTTSSNWWSRTPTGAVGKSAAIRGFLEITGGNDLGCKEDSWWC